MTPYHLAHADLFRSVADILVRDYIAPSETAETVAEWCGDRHPTRGKLDCYGNLISETLMEPSELAALIADVEGYERRHE